MEICHKLWTSKVSPRHVDRVVDKTRRRSSLLTTPTRWAKKRGHRLMTIILSILNRFKIFSLEDSLANLQLHEY